mgnify:CR=1 FL=1
MKILVTGAKGFIGKNLVYALRNNGYDDVLEFDTDTKEELLKEYCAECDFVFNFAGVNRPENIDDFAKGNTDFTRYILSLLEQNNNHCPFMFSSSIQAELENPYGISKRNGEKLVFEYGKRTGAKVLVYRFTNVFGKWCRPSYNSVIATFCYNIARGLPVTINDPDAILNLVHIDDLTNEMLNALKAKEVRAGEYCLVPVTHTVKLGYIADTIKDFAKCRKNLSIPDQSDDFIRKLYSTYLSYLPEDSFSYFLDMHCDSRGSFTEFIRTIDRGQVSINIIKPHIVKGNHWHDTKNEKFLVVSGQGVIRLRKPFSNEITEFYVSGDNMKAVDIPSGYTHNIENTGDSDMVIVMWANEPYIPEKPDTHYLEV